MPFYHRLGKIPHKRHTQFRKADGSLFAEQLVSTEGFSDDYSLVYHHHRPTRVKSIGKPSSVLPVAAVETNLQHRSFQGFKVRPVKDYLESRTTIMFNDDLSIILAAPEDSMESYFFKNSGASEMIFVHEGEGVLKTMYGLLPFRPGDHLIIPRGIIYQLHFEGRANRLLIVESYSAIGFPRRYVSKKGQLLEHAPFCERDIRVPRELETRVETGGFLIYVKRDHMIIPYQYENHPFDLVGWDGYHYPYAFSIHDFEPITGRVHQPPPVHQTFEGRNFVMCAFVPRLYDYHPAAIPAPYNHSNVDSDEVLYYVDGEFMSRKHVDRGQLTLHPTGIPHGPHPGTVEKSIGQKETNEMAVMIDTFRPLKLTAAAMDIEDPDYYLSWLDE